MINDVDAHLHGRPCIGHHSASSAPLEPLCFKRLGDTGQEVLEESKNIAFSLVVQGFGVGGGARETKQKNSFGYGRLRLEGAKT